MSLTKEIPTDIFKILCISQHKNKNIFTGLPWSFLYQRINLLLFSQRQSKNQDPCYHAQWSDIMKFCPTCSKELAGFSHRVDFPMLDKVAVVTEVLATFLTFIRSFSSVNSLMLNEDRTSTKALTALTALVRFLPRVDRSLV